MCLYSLSLRYNLKTSKAKKNGKSLTKFTKRDIFIVNLTISYPMNLKHYFTIFPRYIR